VVQRVPFFLAFLRHDQALLVRAASTDRRAQIEEHREGHTDPVSIVTDHRTERDKNESKSIILIKSKKPKSSLDQCCIALRVTSNNATKTTHTLIFLIHATRTSAEPGKR